MHTRLKQAYWRLWDRVEPIRIFANWRDYFRTFGRQDDAETVLRTRTGLRIAVRHNLYDVQIVKEQFIDRHYLRHFRPRARRDLIVLDVGSYIGDFALYCAHELGARVVAYEPTAENRHMLERNLTLNPALRDRITVVPRGIAAGSEVQANVQVRGREVHVSSYYYADDPTAEQRTFPCDTLAEALDRQGLERVDLLKVDCEGGEYDIFPATPRAVLDRVDSLVFEWHPVVGWEGRLRRVVEGLEAAGFTLEHVGELVHGFRK